MKINFIKSTKVKKVLHEIFKSFLVLLGTAILAFGTGLFLVPFNIVSGGINGIGILLAEAGILTVDIWQYIFYWGLFLVGSMILGFKFTLNTLISTIFYPIFLSLIIRTPMGLGLVNLLCGSEGIHAEMINGVISLNGVFGDAGRLILIAIFGGCLVGLGCGITFVGGGSTGGIDIISFILNKYTGLGVSTATFILDTSIVCVGLIVDVANPSQGDVSANFLAGLVGVLGALSCSLMIEYIYSGRNSAYICDVVTDKPEEVSEYITKKLDRSTTIFNVTGGYTKEEKTMIRIVFSRHEYIKVKDALADIDPSAFVTYTQTKMVHGEGFNKNISSQDNTISRTQKIIKKFKKKNDESK